MNFIENIFSMKNGSLKASSSSVDNEKEALNEAKRLADIVSSGIENEKYSAINRELSSYAPSLEDRVRFVFDHPGTIPSYLAILFCIVFIAVDLYFLFIGCTTLMFSSEYYHYGLTGAIGAGILLSINILIIAKLAKSIRFKNRFDVYYELLGYKSIEYIEDIAICSKFSEGTVIKDLKKSIKLGLIPQGHFSQDNIVFMVSDEVFEKYLEKPAVYDRYFRTALDDRRRISSRSAYVSEIMNIGEEYLKKLDGYRILVKDKSISKEVDSLTKVVAMIFREIDVNPHKAQSLGIFLNYYLPTTEKLLDKYVSLTEGKDATPNPVIRKDIEDALHTSKLCFDGILERLYEEYEMDITSEIAALELVMNTEE